MIILVLNCGSSSLKYQLLDMRSAEDYTLMKKGLVERIGDVVPDHAAGIKLVLDALVSPEEGVIDSLDRIDAVGHRVAHGGEFFDRSVRVTPDVMDKIERCCELAPLHNPANLMGIKAIEQLMPGEPQVAVFDTSFHQTMPDYAYMYALPYRFYEKYRLRRYGFHGTSHKFVAEKACKFVGLDIKKSRIITCHLGNGSSITAIRNGESVDTSMGFTPVEGVVMGTRVGNLDVGAVTFIQEPTTSSTRRAACWVSRVFRPTTATSKPRPPRATNAPFWPARCWPTASRNTSAPMRPCSAASI